MKKQTELDGFLGKLNVVLSWELAGVIQYLHHATMITGPWRESLGEFFKEGSEEARDHAQAVADKIVSLGGVPTVEPAKIRPAADVEGMLAAALQLEKDALMAWETAYDLSAAANRGTAFWMEEYIAHEQEHVDHLRKLTKEISPSLQKGLSSEAQNVG